MYFYEVDNKGRNAKSHYIIAKDKEDAKRIAATQSGTPVAVRKLNPVDNIQKLCDTGKSGLLCKKVRAMALSELFSNTIVKQPENPWELYKEI